MVKWWNNSPQHQDNPPWLYHVQDGSGTEQREKHVPRFKFYWYLSTYNIQFTIDPATLRPLLLWAGFIDLLLRQSQQFN